jgi:hypothetical protein
MIWVLPTPLPWIGPRSRTDYYVNLGFNIFFIVEMLLKFYAYAA